MIRRPPRSTLFPYTTLFRSESAEPETRISARNFLGEIEYRMRYYGSLIGVGAGEGFYVREALNVDDPVALLRSEEHTSELQSRQYLVCRLLLEKKKKKKRIRTKIELTQRHYILHYIVLYVYHDLLRVIILIQSTHRFRRTTLFNHM